MGKLTHKDIDCLLLGDSWFATGGGFPANRAKKIFTTLLNKSNLHLKNLSQFHDKEWLCVASGVGSVKKTNVDLTKNSWQAMKIMERIIGKKIKGVVSGEIGLECLAADAAIKIGKPLVDADMKGGRAAPEPSINMFNLKGQNVLPAVTINTDGDIAIFQSAVESQKIEIFLRNFANMACGALVVWCPKPASEFKKFLIDKTISKTIKLGQLLKNKESFDKLIRNLSAKIIFRGRISKIKEEKNAGFLIRRVNLQDRDNFCSVWVKNENLAVTVNKQVVLTCPDLITLLDRKTLLGLHNANLKEGMSVLVIGLPHDKSWHTKRGHKIFNPKHFGLSFPVVKI